MKFSDDLHKNHATSMWKKVSNVHTMSIVVLGAHLLWVFYVGLFVLQIYLHREWESVRVRHSPNLREEGNAKVGMWREGWWEPM